MYSISICFGPAATVWNLLYKDEPRARAALAEATRAEKETTAVVTDDFGQQLTVCAGQIHALLFEDLDQSQLGQIERGLHNARVQAKAQDRALTDPTISQSLRRSQGPAVMTPFGGAPRMNG